MQNEEGIYLVTGAPSYKSLQLWLKFSTDTSSILKRRPVIVNKVTTEQVSLDNDDPFENNRNFESLVITYLGDDDDNNSGNKSSILVHKDIIKSIHSTETELFALLKDGGIGLLRQKVDTPSLFQLKQEENEDKEEEEVKKSKSINGENELFLLKFYLKSLQRLKGGSNSTTTTWFWDDSIPRFNVGLPIDFISCGEGHICCVTRPSNGRRLFTWGDNAQGQCGFNRKISNFISEPSLVFNETLSQNYVISLNCGPEYTTCVIFHLTGKHEIYSFGVQPSSYGFSTTKKRKLKGERKPGTLPHADVNQDSGLIPLISIFPSSDNNGSFSKSTATNSSSNGPNNPERPIQFWTSSLSKWLMEEDEKWYNSLSSTTLDVVEDNKDAIIELENARGRAKMMEGALLVDISAGKLFPILDDPAPFEIRKFLAKNQNELKIIEKELALIEGDLKFDLDRIELLDTKEKLLDVQQAYKQLDTLWMEDEETENTDVDDEEEKRLHESESQILFPLLEDCRKSDFGYLVQTDSVGLTLLLEKSDELLIQVEESLNSISQENQNPSSLFLSIFALCQNKKKINQELKLKISVLSMSLSKEVNDMRNAALEKFPDKYDFSQFS